MLVSAVDQASPADFWAHYSVVEITYILIDLLTVLLVFNACLNPNSLHQLTPLRTVQRSDLCFTRPIALYKFGIV